jgi:hypothetical protein
MKVVMGHLRAKGIRLIIYLDDILILSRSFSEALDHCAVVADTLTSLGFVINEAKSVKQPVQRIDYLGVVVDSTKLSFALPQEKMDQVLKLCKKALGSKDITLRDISKILGNFAWAIHSIPFRRCTTGKFKISIYNNCTNGTVICQKEFYSRRKRGAT